MKTSIVRKFAALYSSASEAQKAVGVAWYESAHETAQSLAIKHGIPLFQSAGVLAALSPNNKWERNKIDADLFIASPHESTKVCTFLGQREKAALILQCETEEEVEYFLSGKKTIAFFQNILHCKTSDNVTVDLWIMRAAELPEEKGSIHYDAIRRIIRRLAKRAQISPLQYQAVIWNTIRPL